MPPMRTALLLGGLLTLGSLVGCQQKGPNDPPDVQIDQGMSAERYPAMLDRQVNRSQAREGFAKERIAAMPTSLDKLSETDWEIVEKIVDASDAAGKDGGYAATVRELEATRGFFDDEREAIVKKVGGAVQYAGKQKGCELDAWGAVSASLTDAVDDRMKERLRSNNDAFLLIDRHRETLGKKNISALEDAADGIAETSYTVNVELPEAKERVESTMSGISGARSALKGLIDDEKEFQASGERKPEEKKGSDARIKRAEEALTKLDAAEAKANEQLKDLEQRVLDLDKAYSDALSKLRSVISEKKTKK